MQLIVASVIILKEYEPLEFYVRRVMKDWLQ